MSHLNPGLISAYNSLTDKHLAGYFSNTRIRRHLQRAGLITRSGRIVPDKEYRHKLIQRAHQRHVRECLAQAIFHKVLEMEVGGTPCGGEEKNTQNTRVHQIEIKRRLEEFARRERVHKIKVERSKRYEEDIIRILSPRPPTGARGIWKQHSGPEGEHSESSESPGSSRPNTAPGKMQRPLDKETSRRRLTTKEASCGISPYCLPVINNFVTPMPPTTKRKEGGIKVTPSGTLRGRRLRPTTASSGADVNEDPPMLRSSVHQSRVCVNMVYFGKSVHLSHDLTDMGDEVKVFQQHCGGENLCVYKGKLREGDTFQFISRRHRGFPFSLTFFLNGLQVERLSSCCEFKHRKGSRLGGRHGHFGFSSVEGASPCYKCIIAMGLDKKPTPPPKRVKEDGRRVESVISPKTAPEMETERTREDAASHSECETSRPRDMETQVKEETAAQEDKVRDDYEEDFEADDEGPAEDVEAKGKKSPSPFGETETQVKEREASESEDDERDEDIKSHSGSSSSGSDREESDAEATVDSRGEEKADKPKEADQEETEVLPDEKDEPNPANPEEAAGTESESAVAKDSDAQNSAGDSTEIDVSENSVPSGIENKQSDDTAGDKEVEQTVDESKQEEEQERAKSVQEKLAEAILKESHCSSEPELSDTSTEEEEESTENAPEQANKDAVPEKSVTIAEQQQTPVEETKCEEGDVGEAEVAVEDREETSEPKEQEHKTVQELCEDSDSTEDQKVKTEEEHEKAASEEDIAENNKSDDTEDTRPAPTEETAEDDKTSAPREDAAAKSTDAAEKDEENKERTAVEADVQPDETGQGAKSSEEDESSVSEPNKKTDETAVPDNAEAMTASETMEMKAEPSEEREALKCEEAPVTDTEKRPRGEGEGRDVESETGVTAENSSSSFDESGDTAVEKTTDLSEGKENDESTKDDAKEGEADEASAAEASKDDSQRETCDVGGEQTEKSAETDDKVEEKPEEESEKEEKQTAPDGITEGENSEDRETGDKDKTRVEEKSDDKTDERTKNEETISDRPKSDSEEKANEEQAEEIHSEEDKLANEEKADESEKPENDEASQRVENEIDEGESEETGATADKTNEGEKTNETSTAAVGENDGEAEREKKDQNENIAEQCEVAKDDGESEEKKVGSVEGEETSEITEEPEKSADADLDRDNVKISDENIFESEDISDSEAANVAHEAETTEEVLNSLIGAEAAAKEIEEGSEKSEKGEIDAENGEISSGAKNKTHEGEAQAEGENDMQTEQTAEHTEDKIKAEGPAKDESTEVREVASESGDGAGKHEEGKVDHTDTDTVVSEAKERDDGVEKQDESIKNDPEPETSGTEIKAESKSDDRKDGEEAKQDENGNISEPDHENKDSDLTKNNDVNAAMVASSSTLLAADSDDAAHKVEGSTAPSVSETDKHPQADENAASAATDLSAADGENGDTEEASKASEEGASVLLKPQAQSSPLTQNNEAENTEESAAVEKETPEALVIEDNTDMVINWVTAHQASKFFETFVEPLEDLRPSDTQVSKSGKEATQSTEPPRSESPLKMVKRSENAEQEHMLEDVNESKDETKEEAIESGLESKHSEGSEPHENNPAEDMLLVEEETEVKDFIPNAEIEQNDKDEHKGSQEFLDKVQEGLMQDNTEQTEISKTEVESIASTHHSVTSGKSESTSENQTDEKTTDNGPDLTGKETAVEEIKDLLRSSETQEHREYSASPEGLSEVTANKLENSDETWEKSREVTEITDFTESKSNDGSQEESHPEATRPKASDESINGDRRDVQLIQDIKHTLSKDRLSTFSVDETLFGQSSYPLLAAARTESGH
ncbi:hypothetical protein L3Q82_007998 [Scortum barcoo]|uniref:Uncharacterized protein n=1 Tax=Scortum barcoo TaxID=214431 RepID=A0ACB8WJN2_9TELE|nr:hypothetical protein L3Q82_007998 [Scortum barcoo]